MNLHGSIKELQNNIVQLYLSLEQRFSENQLVRDLWAAMAHDVSQQIHSLDALPQSFWNQLKKEPDALLMAAAQSARHQIVDAEGDLSLRLCLEQALQLEEPAILKIYVPLIRKLRENLTAPALDFYIVVKAHLARITRVTQSFAGDPVIIQRSNALLQTFEKEVQEQHAEARVPHKAKAHATPVQHHEEPAKKTKKTAAKSHPLAKRNKALHTRTKPVVKKVAIQRRRARR